MVDVMEVEERKGKSVGGIVILITTRNPVTQ